MERPRSMPRYSASRLAGMGVLSAAAHDGSASSLGAAAAAALSLPKTSSAKRTRFWLPRRAISRFFFFRFSDEERHGRSRGRGDGASSSEEGSTRRCCFARHRE